MSNRNRSKQHPDPHKCKTRPHRLNLDIPEGECEPEKDGDTQERSDIIASQESIRRKDGNLMADEPTDKMVEGFPEEGETEMTSVDEEDTEELSRR